MTTFVELLNGEFVRFVEGSSPYSVVIIFNRLKPEVQTELAAFAIVCALTCRRAVAGKMDDIIRSNPDLFAAIQKDFMINNKLNFSALSILGHVALAKGWHHDKHYVIRYNNKYGSKHLYEIDLSKASKTRADILMQLRKKFSYADFEEAVAKMAPYSNE
jgi:hypothetical protein